MNKRGLVVIVVLWSSYLYGMECSALYIYGKTKIHLTKGSPYDCDGKVNCIIFEKNEQQLLYELFADNWLVGHTQIAPKKTVYIYYKDTNSYFEDDVYNSCYNNLIQKSQENVIEKRLLSMSIEVTEPLIFKSQHSGEYYYYAEKIDKGVSEYPSGRKYFGAEAIEQASNDLVLCYDNALIAGLRKHGGKKKKSIALPALGTAVDFPREKAALIAVPTILEFIKNNPKGYDRIELLVKKRSEFVLYKELLAAHTVQKK